MDLNISDTKVVNSRYFKGQNVIWRRRKTSGGIVFTTRERFDLTGKKVIKSGNRPVEAFQPAKLLLSLISTLDHRKDATEAAWALLATIENRLTTLKNDSIHSEDIAKAVLEVLKAFDSAAYLNYARHHTELVSKEDMIQAISR